MPLVIAPMVASVSTWPGSIGSPDASWFTMLLAPDATPPATVDVMIVAAVPCTRPPARPPTSEKHAQLVHASC